MEADFEKNLSPEEYLQCGICNQQGTRPKLLRCLHTFCEECLQTKCKDQCIKCPTCDQLTEGDVGSLKDNILVANIRSKLEKQQEIRQSLQLVCGVCKASSFADFLCLLCDKFFCFNCFQNHEILLKNHRNQTEPVEKLKTLSSADFLKVLRRPKNLFCKNHEEEEEQISAYCITCSICLCLNCVVLEHKEHTYQSIKKEAISRRRELVEAKSSVVEIGKKFIKTREDLKLLVDNLRTSKYKVEDLIKAKVSLAIEKIQEEESKQLGELEKLYGGKVKMLEQNLKKTENVLERVTASTELVGKMLKYATDHEVLEMQGTVTSALGGLLGEEPPKVFVQDLSIDFEECSSDSQFLLGKLIVKKQANTQSRPMPLQTAQQGAEHIVKDKMAICQKKYAMSQEDIEYLQMKIKNFPINLAEASDSEVQSPVAKTNSDYSFSLCSPEEICKKRKNHEDTVSPSLRKKHKKTQNSNEHQIKLESREVSEGHSGAYFPNDNPHNPSCSSASISLVPVNSDSHCSRKETEDMDDIVEILIDSDDSK
ncbi:protein PML isoform X1 [Callorhinchus milii]|nr:protein PML isoform X1 [Callorhinchus milii]XP_042193164.1 protein PML isoform X1 [Callorhinchus milii]